MAYIGNNVQTQGFTPAIDYFSGNGVTVTFTLSRPVASVAQVIIAIDNVVQNSSTAYTVSGNSITFTSAPLSGTNNIWVQYTSPITTYNAISQDPSVIGDLTASGGFLSTGDFGNSYIDGTIVDYVTGNARITTGPADGITFYNGGTSARYSLAAWDTSGNLTNTGNITTTGTGSFGTTSNSYAAFTAYAGSGNTAVFQKSGGSAAIGFGSATVPNFLMEAINGGGMTFYSGSGSWASPSWYPVLSITNGGALTVNNSSSGGVSLQPSGQTYQSRIWNANSSNIYIDNNSSCGYVFSYGAASYFAATTAASFTVASDYRLKENVTPIVNALDKVAEFKPVHFNYKSDIELKMPFGEDTVDGFLAHEFAEVVPFAVTGEKDAVDEDGKIKPQAIDMAKAVPLLVAAIKELKAEVDALKAGK